MLNFLTKRRPGYWPAFTWLIISTVLLCLPGSKFPKYNWLSDIQFDKWVHIGLFGILVLFGCWGHWSRKKTNEPLTHVFMLFAGLATAYGIGMEFVQDQYIPFRDFDIWDICADAIGAIAGGWFSHWRFHKK